MENFVEVRIITLPHVEVVRVFEIRLPQVDIRCAALVQCGAFWAKQPTFHIVAAKQLNFWNREDRRLHTFFFHSLLEKGC